MNKQKLLYHSHSNISHSYHFKYKRKKSSLEEGIFTNYKKEILSKKQHYHEIDTRPLKNFLLSKIGKKWDDIYSEILKKIKPSDRWLIERSINWMVYFPFYDDEYIPNFKYGRFSYQTEFLLGRLFVDYYGRLSLSSEEEVLSLSKNLKRRAKLIQLENLKNEG